MKTIPPHQITNEILNLINEAEEYLILVSPYVNFNNWEHIKRCISNAQSRNVNIIFYTRLDNDNQKSWEQIENLNIDPKLIKNLHAKMYFSEKAGVVTSMNLLVSSNLSAIEFGIICNTKEELFELQDFVKKYLEPNVEKEKPSNDDLYLAKAKFNTILTDYLSRILQKNVSCRWEKGALKINANNQYYASLDKAENKLYISSIISKIEYDSFEVFSKNTQVKNLADINLYPPKGNSLSSVEIVSRKKFSNSNFDFLMVAEKKEILEIVATFIRELNDHKKYCFENCKD